MQMLLILVLLVLLLIFLVVCVVAKRPVTVAAALNAFLEHNNAKKTSDGFQAVLESLHGSTIVAGII